MDACREDEDTMENSDILKNEENQLNELIKELHKDRDPLSNEVPAEIIQWELDEQPESAEGGAEFMPNDSAEADNEPKKSEAEESPEPKEAPEVAGTPEPEADKLHMVPSQRQRDILVERIDQKKRYRRTLTATVTVLALIAAVAVFIAMVLCPVIKVSGSGMEPTYTSGDIVVLLNAKEYEGGELCCISYQNKLLVKRIIAKPGDKVSIDENGNVSVNGALLDEPYAINKCVGECNVEFPLVVPENAYFVLGDRRDTSIDSRSTLIGCVKKEDIVGRVLIKVWPMDSNQ